MTMYFMTITRIILQKLGSVLEGIKKVASKKKITTIFQPHRFSRVQSLKKVFEIF